MKLLTFVTSSGPRLGLVDGITVLDVNAAVPDVPSDLRVALAVGVAMQEVASLVRSSDVARIPLSSIHHAPPVPAPGKTICLGLNYFDHAAEGGRDRPDYPWLFFRGATSLLGHGQPGRVPRVSAQLDFEAELAVIIATTVPRHTAEATRCGMSSVIPASTTCQYATTRSARRSGRSERTSTQPEASGQWS